MGFVRKPNHARNLIPRTLVLLGSLIWACSSLAEPHFERAMVFSGKSINTALFLGMFDAAADAGQPADLVIGACGGAIGAALVHVDPDRESRLAFLKSREYYEMLKNVSLSPVNALEFGGVLMRERRAAKKNRSRYQKTRTVLADWFNFSLVHVGEDFEHLPKFDVPFTSSGTAAVLVAAQTTFAPSARDQVFDVTHDLFKEVYLTDPETAKLMRGMYSPVALEFPGSAVELKTEALSPGRMMQAVRASIGDAIYIGSSYLDGHHYFTGAIDLNPIAVGIDMAKEVISTYPSSFDSLIESPIAQAMFDYDPNEYLRRILKKNQVSYWVDMSDASFPNLSPRGKLDLAGAIEKGDLARFIKIESYIPGDYSRYVEAVDQQYRYAYLRTLEAMKRPQGDLKHIRKPLK